MSSPTILKGTMLPPGPPNAVDGHEAPSPQFPSLPYKHHGSTVSMLFWTPE